MVQSRSYCDFLVSFGDATWLIELLRDSSQVEEHYGRITGKYGMIPRTQYAVLDIGVHDQECLFDRHIIGVFRDLYRTVHLKQIGCPTTSYTLVE